MTQPERPNIRLSDEEDETPKERRSRLDRLEERIEKLEHWRTFQIGLVAAFSFCSAFIGYLITTYVLKK